MRRLRSGSDQQLLPGFAISSALSRLVATRLVVAATGAPRRFATANSPVCPCPRKVVNPAWGEPCETSLARLSDEIE